MAALTTGKRKVPLSIAHKAAQRLRAHLEPFCERVEVAGSIRRGKPQVSDIEIVAIPKRAAGAVQGDTSPQQMSLFGEPVVVQPAAQVTCNLLDEELARMVARGMLRREPPPGWDVRIAWGERYKKAWLHLNDTYGWIQLDLFLATADNWGAILTIRTGSRAFSEALVTYIKRATPYRQQGGDLVYSPTGEVRRVATERAYFAEVGVRWLEPRLRDERAARRLYACLRAENSSSNMRYTDSRVRAAIRDRLERGL